jgi:hypothetical protein
MTPRRVIFLLAAWAVGQLISWGIIEPVGLLAAMLCTSREARRRFARRARVGPTPEQPPAGAEAGPTVFRMLRDMVAEERGVGASALLQSNTSAPLLLPAPKASSQLVRRSSSRRVTRVARLRRMLTSVQGRQSASVEPAPPLALASMESGFQRSIVTSAIPELESQHTHPEGATASPSEEPSHSEPVATQFGLGPRRMMPSTTNFLPPLSQRARVEPVNTSAPSSASANPSEHLADVSRPSVRLPRSGRLNRVVPMTLPST